MASKLKVDQIEGQSGTSVEVPTGHTLKVADLGNNKILSTNSSGIVTATAMGSTDQVLKMTGSNTIGFGAISGGDIVKVVSATGGGTTALALDSCFSATYENYLIVANLYASGGAAGPYIRIQNASNTEQNSGNYHYAATQIFKNNSGSGSDNKTGWNQNEISMQENIGTDSGSFGSYQIYVAKPFVSDSYTNFIYDFISFDNTYLRSVRGGGMYAVAQRNAGFRFSSSNSNTFSSASKVTVYGLKD